MASEQWQVLKFGGTSVSTKSNWQTITQIVKQKLVKNKKVFIVHSALNSVSNRLEKLIDYAVQREGAKVKAMLHELVKLHQILIRDLQLDDSLLVNEYANLEKFLDGLLLLGEASDRIQAIIMAQGELFSTKIGHAYLSKEIGQTLWVDARDYLKSESGDCNYLSANCNYQRDEQLLSELETRNIVISQGFIGANLEQDTVLLGRGGSDTSAAYFAAKLAAERLEIWTDVEGIFTANPSQVANARLLKQLNYDEAQEMASAGAKVLHPRAIRPVKEFNIPSFIRSTLNPAIEGTQIHNTETSKGIVKAITAKNDVFLISMESQGMWQQAGYLADLFAIYKKHAISIDLVSTSETNVTVTLDHLSQKINDKRLDKLLEDLSEVCTVEILRSCSAVSIVGQNVRAILHKIAPALNIFETYPVYLLSQAASDLNLTFVIDSDYCDRVIASLHELLISNNPNSQILGPTIAELNSTKNSDAAAWWKTNQTQLAEILQDNDHAYVYSREQVKKNISALKQLSSVSKIFFATKANNNKELLKTVHSEQLGFEAVSLAEIDLVLSEFSGLDKQSIFFTPNFASKEEYQTALSLSVNVSLDSAYPLLNWPEIFANQSIFLRIDPSIGKGHHENVRTAGATSKFGIPMDELSHLTSILQEYNISVVGLHAHAGSGILSPQHWAEHARLLAELAQDFPQVKYLNLGGGFGIKERSGQSSLDIQEVNEALKVVCSEYPQFEYWVEPGRYLVANAGVLVAKVTQVKQKQNYYYVGISTGMNSLMRPALYGSYHPIENLSRLESPKDKLATIVGPICESTDKLGIEIPFPETKEGDLVLIENTGAYGHVMSNYYNLREPAKEFCI